MRGRLRSLSCVFEKLEQLGKSALQHAALAARMHVFCWCERFDQCGNCNTCLSKLFFRCIGALVGLLEFFEQSRAGFCVCFLLFNTNSKLRLVACFLTQCGPMFDRFQVLDVRKSLRMFDVLTSFLLAEPSVGPCQSALMRQHTVQKQDAYPALNTTRKCIDVRQDSGHVSTLVEIRETKQLAA